MENNNNTSWFDDTVVEEARELYDSKSFELSGEFVVQLKYCYISDSQSSSARAVTVEFEYPNGMKGREQFWFINKFTGTQRTPDDKPTFGSIQVEDFFGAMGMRAKVTPLVDTKITVLGKEAEMPVFRALFDKTIRVVVQMKEERDDRDGSISEKIGVMGWYNVDTRLNAKEIMAGATEPKQIERDLKRCTKLRKLKASKTEPTQASKDAPADNPWAN